MTVALVLPLLLGVALLQWRWIARHRTSLFKLSAAWYVERLPCELCGVTGMIRADEMPMVLQICPVCLGRGAAYIRRTDKLDVICPACGGMGRILDGPGEAHYCERCGGRGLIRVQEIEENAAFDSTQ